MIPVTTLIRIVSLTLGLLILPACATQVPKIIKEAPAEDVSLTRIQTHPDKHIGKMVRWGGSIISTQNLKNKTELTILAKPLDTYGEPVEGDRSYGRFIAVLDNFLDPAIYAAGRSITIYGRFEKLLDKKIDNFPYRYPLVNIQHLYLWEVPEKYNYYDYPYWYDPWYPYWGPYYYRPHRHY